MQLKMIKTIMLVFFLAIAGGCATNMNQLAEVQAMAESAMDKANDAYNLAATSHNLASEAAYEAEQAKNAANSSMECCNANTKKIDRMFEKAMSK